MPAAAILVRADALRAIDGFQRALRLGEDVDAVWRLVEAGWRCRYEPASVVHHRPRGSWRALIAQRFSYGSSAAALAQRHPGALAPVRVERVERRGVGLLAAGQPLPAAAVAGGTAAALVPKLRGVPPSDSLRLALLGHLHAGRSLADAGRRAWWPILLAGALVSRRARLVAALATVPALVGGGVPRLVDDLAYGVGLWKGVVTERQPGPAAAVLHAPGRGAPDAEAGTSPLTLRLTVDTEAWRRHAESIARHAPGLVPVVKGNGYGFGRAELAEIAAGLADTIAVGTVHELDRPAGRRVPVVLTPSRRPPHDMTPILTVGSIDHVSALAGWPGRVLVKLMSSVRRYGVTVDDLGPVTRAARAAGLEVVGFSVHPPVAGTDDEHVDDIAAWLDVLQPDDEVWVSHLSTDGYGNLRDSWPGRRFRIRLGYCAVARRQAHPAPRRRRARRPPGPRRRARRLPATAGAARRPPRDGRCRHRPRRAPARPTAAAPSTSPANAWPSSNRRTCTPRWSSCRPASTGPEPATSSTYSTRSSRPTPTRCAGDEGRHGRPATG